MLGEPIRYRQVGLNSYGLSKSLGSVSSFVVANVCFFVSMTGCGGLLLARVPRPGFDLVRVHALKKFRTQDADF